MTSRMDVQGSVLSEYRAAQQRAGFHNTDAAKLLLLSSLLFKVDRISKGERQALKVLTIRKDSSLIAALRAFELLQDDLEELEENVHIICAEYERLGHDAYFERQDMVPIPQPQPVQTGFTLGAPAIAQPSQFGGALFGATPSPAVFFLNDVDKKRKKQASAVPKTPAPFQPLGGASSGGGVGGGMLAHLVEPGWKRLLAAEFEKPYFQEIVQFVQMERQGKAPIYPSDEEVFNAFNYTPLDQVKVVILGQDPYFNPGQAHGLCFSVKKGVAVPPSLITIYKELERSIPGFKRPPHGCLEEWARQGVLLLNATLTVRYKEPNSHAKCGWQEFTDAVIRLLNEEKQGLVYLLWGGFAQKKGRIVDRSKHTVLEAAHPSPMAGNKGFEGCNHFALANDILSSNGLQPIDWRITP